MDCDFQFATSTRILFGDGSVGLVADEAEQLGSCAFIVTGFNADRANFLLRQLAAKSVKTVPFQVSGEPTVAVVKEGACKARKAACDLVIGYGGGSVLDGAKAIAALLTNPGEVEDYLEVVGRGRKLARKSAPFVAIPTTAGTGSEVTHNAVIGSHKHRVKVSMRSEHMQPTLAVVDPSLTLSVPPMVTASTGLDALTQLIEAYVSCEANPALDAVCREGMKRAARSLHAAFENGDDRAAREDMCLASLFGGLALANAKLGAVHGLAGPIGGMFPAPHGAVCARLLPYVMEANVAALKQRAAKLPYLERFQDVARTLTGKTDVAPANGVAWAKGLALSVRIPALSDFGVTENDFSPMVKKAQNASSMKGNPIPLTDEELTGVLQKAL